MGGDAHFCPELLLGLSPRVDGAAPVRFQKGVQLACRIFVVGDRGLGSHGQGLYIWLLVPGILYNTRRSNDYFLFLVLGCVIIAAVNRGLGRAQNQV